MNRFIIAAAVATSVFSLTGVTNAKAEQTGIFAPTAISAERFDTGPAPMPLGESDAAYADITFEDGAEFYEHALNDAWLGMPFEGLQGDVIGYVVDAPVDENGDVAEVHVGTPNLEWNEQDEPVDLADLLVFPVDQVVLTDEAVVLQPTDSELVANLVE